MKQKLFLAIFLCFAVYVSAQDKLIFLTGDTLNARIVKLTKSDVFLTKQGFTDTTILSRSVVQKINYQNGTILNLNKPFVPIIGLVKPGDSLYNLGYAHADNYYKKYKSAVTGTLITSIFIPYGLIPALICSNHRPEVQNLTFPDINLAKDASYYAGYSDRAYKIKKKKVWTGFAIGSGISVATIIILPLLLVY